MKIKVDKDEYENIKKDLEMCKRYIECSSQRHILHMQEIEKQLDEYFNKKVHTYLIKRDREAIIAEVKESINDNLFKDVK